MYQNGVANEENGRIVADQIPNTLLGVEFDSKTAWITSRIGRTRFTTNSRKSNRLNSIRENLLKEINF